MLLNATRLLCIALAASLLGACATLLPAEEVCSANWIKPRADAAISEFRSATEDSWNSLRSTGERVAEKGELGLLERASALVTITRLVNAFQNSQALDDLRTLGRTCDDPELVQNALRSTLQEYGVPNQYIELLDELSGFVELMQNASGS